jgi:2',3'-cyclic-nucleotide 2'-phosphodiesterase (5'-nucleotidase family)
LLHILHLNDTELAPDQVFPRVATLVRRARATGQCDLLLHAGDVRFGAAHGRAMVRVFNHLGVDGFTPGNHDLDDGIDLLARQVAELQADTICSNVSGCDRFLPYRIYLRQGIRVAVCGVTLEEMPLLQPERNIPGMRFLRPSAALLSLIPELRRQADVIVVLSHCGLEADMELAREVPAIDLIIGGHSHHLLTEPVRVGKTQICQAGAWGEHVGWIRLDLAGGSLTVEAGVTPVAGLEPDPEVAALSSAPPAAERGEITGYTTVDLRSADYARETPLGNLTADLMRAAAGTEIALLRCSSVANTLPPGPIRQVDLVGFSYTADDQLARLRLTGRDLLQVLECGARDSYYLLNASGAQVVYDGTRPEGTRVIAARIGGRPLEPDRVYTVACSEILARGAAGFVPMQGRPYQLLSVTIRQVLAEHLQAVKTISPALDGRLVIHGELPRRR